MKLNKNKLNELYSLFDKKDFIESWGEDGKLTLGNVLMFVIAMLFFTFITFGIFPFILAGGIIYQFLDSIEL